MDAKSGYISTDLLGYEINHFHLIDRPTIFFILPEMWDNIKIINPSVKLIDLHLDT